jgi:hypothetical protein
MVNIQEAKYEGQYRIWVKFNTGESGVIDLVDEINHFKAAAPLKDTQEFALFYLDEWPTLAWSCGFDLAPEYLYEKLTGKQPVWISSSAEAA